MAVTSSFMCCVLNAVDKIAQGYIVTFVVEKDMSTIL